jgi:hypothetical protein
MKKKKKENNTCKIFQLNFPVSIPFSNKFQSGCVGSLSPTYRKAEDPRLGTFISGHAPFVQPILVPTPPTGLRASDRPGRETRPCKSPFFVFFKRGWGNPSLYLTLDTCGGSDIVNVFRGMGSPVTKSPGAISRS